MTATERLATEESVSLFAQAGLPLPPVDIRRHYGFRACSGHQGLHRRLGDRSVIDICTTDVGDYEQRTIIHELAHAWSWHYLTAEHKQAFQDLRGWEYWLNYDRASWKDNGAEQAAEIILWALSDHPIRVAKIRPNSCADLHDGYVALTGLEPLHGYTQLCNPPKVSTNRW